MTVARQAAATSRASRAVAPWRRLGGKAVAVLTVLALRGVTAQRLAGGGAVVMVVGYTARLGGLGDWRGEDLAADDGEYSQV